MHAVFVGVKDLPQVWVPFECDGHIFEYSTLLTRMKGRDNNTPAHKPATGKSVRIVMVGVRKLGTAMGPAMIFPKGTIPDVERARETVRFFAAHNLL
jgi:hypothetical protein